MSGNYEAFITDFGGVLTTPLQDAMAKFAESEGIELQDFVRVALGAYSGGEDSLVTRFETGHATEAEFSQAMSERLTEIAGHPIVPEGLVARIFAGIRLENEMLQLVRDVKGMGLKTALLSNSWGTELYPPDLEGLFDVSLISGEIGLRKPDPAIFALAAQRVGTNPDRCIFVDDHPGHLEAAGEMGMTTVLHRTPAQTRDEVLGLLAGGPTAASN